MSSCAAIDTRDISIERRDGTTYGVGEIRRRDPDGGSATKIPVERRIDLNDPPLLGRSSCVRTNTSEEGWRKPPKRWDRTEPEECDRRTTVLSEWFHATDLTKVRSHVDIGRRNITRDGERVVVNFDQPST